MNNRSNIMVLQGQFEKLNNVHYEIDIREQTLGEGGTGIVRHGVMVDENSGIRRDVAIKFLYNDLSENAIQRSRREAEIHIVHENLIEMLGFVQIGEMDLYGKGNVHYHVVSELLNGVMLLDMLNEKVQPYVYSQYPKIKSYHDELMNNRYSFALRIIRCILSGIMMLHDKGYIHRDIDPSNIMITDEGKVKLIDLGICKRLETINTTSLTSIGQFVGKEAYAAPELASGDINHQNVTTDIYAVGIMLFQIITGSLPFTGTMQDVLEKQKNEKIILKPIRDKKVRELIKKATEKKQSDRFQSAAEFRVAIDSIKNIKIESTDSDNIWLIAAILSFLGLGLGALLAFMI